MTATEHPEPSMQHPADRRTNPGNPPAMAWVVSSTADRLEHLLAHLNDEGELDPTLAANLADVHTLRQVARALEGSAAASRPVERRTRP